MQSKAKTVTAYLDSLPADRREHIEAVRKIILKNLPKGMVEVMNWGMITYEIPLSVYPDTYNKKPLMYAALASQKNHMAVYLCSIYCNNTFRKEIESKIKKSNLGRSCIRFKKAEDLPLKLIAKIIAGTTMQAYIEVAKEAHKK